MLLPSITLIFDLFILKLHTHAYGGVFMQWDMQEDFTAAQSSYLLALGEEEGEKGPKGRLPSSVTVPKRGPLALKTTACQYLPDKTAPSSQKPKVFTNPKCHHRPKHSLTHCSFPLRPLEQIEGELGELSCVQLRDSLELMTVSLQNILCLITQSNHLMQSTVVYSFHSQNVDIGWLSKHYSWEVSYSHSAYSSCGLTAVGNCGETTMCSTTCCMPLQYQQHE